MTPEETATATAEATSAIGSRFMLDPATYARGAELGFSGMDFYVTGRGGVLGDVDADEVTAAFVWFEPGTVRSLWEQGTKVLPPERAAEEFAACAHRWAGAHVPDDVDAARLAELAGAVVTAADGGAAPLFEGWRRLPTPSEPKALAVHHLNALRELRGGLHGAAMLETGLTALEAMLVKTPYMAAMFGWGEPHPDVTACAERWERGEAATDRAMAKAFVPLSEAERAELAGLMDAVHAATSG